MQAWPVLRTATHSKGCVCSVCCGWPQWCPSTNMELSSCSSSSAWLVAMTSSPPISVPTSTQPHGLPLWFQLRHLTICHTSTNHTHARACGLHASHPRTLRFNPMRITMGMHSHMGCWCCPPRSSQLNPNILHSVSQSSLMRPSTMSTKSRHALQTRSGCTR